jgi:glycosyltransferase involved in cell wall biosynthesis
VQIVLIGRVGEGDPEPLLDVLEVCTNIHLLGPRSYRELPDYLRGFDLALLPCPINAYTCSMFPMKFFEYVAAGLPVVSTDLPALREYSHLAHLCPDRASFLASIDALLQDAPIEGLRRPVALESLPDWCSYLGRTESMLAALAYRLAPADHA